MLVMLSGTLAMDALSIKEMWYTSTEESTKTIVVTLSDGEKWSLPGRGKRYFSALVKKVNEAQAKMTVKGSEVAQD